MYAEERQQAIAELIGRRGRMSVADLATRFRVTTETVRRDLALLERLGHVRRVHGGAIPTAALTVTEPAQFRATIAAGIGSAKAFGFGLLVLMPVSTGD